MDSVGWIIAGSCLGVILCLLLAWKCIRMIDNSRIDKYNYEKNERSTLRQKYRALEEEKANAAEIAILTRNQPASEHMRIVQEWRAMRVVKQAEARTIREQAERERTIYYRTIWPNLSPEEQRFADEQREVREAEARRLQTAADRELDEVIRKKMELDGRTKGNMVIAQGSLVFDNDRLGSYSGPTNVLVYSGSH